MTNFVIVMSWYEREWIQKDNNRIEYVESEEKMIKILATMMFEGFV